MSAALLILAGIALLWLVVFALGWLEEDAHTGFVVANVVTFGLPLAMGLPVLAIGLVVAGIGRIS